MEKYIDYLVNWLQKQVTNAHAKGLIVGVSGGVDSAVVANLIKRAFPNDSLGLIMPCHSKDEDVEHGMIVVNDCNLDYHLISLDASFEQLMADIEDKIDISSSFTLARANTKARLRMTTLYAIAQNHGYLVCGTDNACEWYTGYFTKYGDGGVDIAPLVQLTKSQVYELAHLLNVDEKIINKPPSAGLIGNQSDEEEMQVTYKELEDYLSGKKISIKAKERIEYLHKVSEHKRNIVSFPKEKVSDII